MDNDRNRRCYPRSNPQNVAGNGRSKSKQHRDDTHESKKYKSSGNTSNPQKDAGNWKSKSKQHRDDTHHFESNPQKDAGNWRSQSKQHRDDTHNFDSKKYKSSGHTDGLNNSFNQNVDKEKYRPNMQRRPRNMGFKYLEDLLKMDTEEMIMKVKNDRNGFEAALQRNDNSDDFKVLIVYLMKKVCESPFLEINMSIYQTILGSNFRRDLLNYISTLHVQEKSDRIRNKYFWNDMDKFWYSLLESFQFILDRSPSFAIEVLQKLVKSVLTAIPLIENTMEMHFSDEVTDKFRDMQKKLEIVSETIKAKYPAPVLEGCKEESEPPNDFHDISIYPIVKELISSESVFLRKNVVEGPYTDIAHYLDIQFRLLREDFVAPLREGIRAYLQKDKRPQDVKVYENVFFLNPEVVNNQNCFKIRFAPLAKKKTTYKYENSRRFMFGSLLCFTKDKFSRIMFGKVAERKVEMLEEGQLIVGFDSNQDTFIDYKTPYLMLECSVYFEPYFHVLSVLKNMDYNSFPMEKYIVNVNNTPEHPKYITHNTVYKIEGYEFSPLAWPNRRFYGLNESQSNAFRAALTQEFAVIQGPPGTGKTFLGLKIAQTLLENRRAWYKQTPMLVICYTNHALDQFLEGLLPITGSIIRVGGQSKSEVLQRLNIRKQKQLWNDAIVQRRHDLRVCLSDLKQVNEYLDEINNYNSIVHFGCFKSVIPNYITTWFHSATHYDIKSWLLSRKIGESYNPRKDGLRQLDEIQVGNEEFSDSDIEDNFDEDVFGDLVVPPFSNLMAIRDIKREIRFLEKELESIDKDEDMQHLEKIIRTDKIAYSLEEHHKVTRILEDMLLMGREKRFRRIQNFHDFLTKPQRLAPIDRWNFYFTLLELYEEQLHKKYEKLNVKFKNLYEQFNGLREIEDVRSMKRSLVIGMTTTGAARLRSSLQALKSPIVIVEEAAEVLEAHIVTSLTSSCQHLILIGDHQQLKPSAASYRIEKFFYLGISLFERMVLNKIQCNMLNVQHRMRPEISSLITPHIYPNLQNHESVFNRPIIRGIDKPLYFIDHRVNEQQCSDESKKNQHEAKFLIRLARHLVLNGYDPKEITILAAYLGQMYEMQREKKKYEMFLRSVRIAVLDNYQGEECEIILLSLVRSNNDSKIGFLDIENRVCVALSRARTGFYIMGNMHHLCENNKSQIWPKIRKTLEDQQAIGLFLKLRCQIHPFNITSVGTHSDFDIVHEGGCKELCKKLLACGHTCQSQCHLLDQTHEASKCMQPCTNLLCDLNDNHVCKKMCFEECGPCDYLVERNLKCGHTVRMKCSKDPMTYNCKEEVFTKLPCGHETNKPCYKDPVIFKCPFPCETLVEPCGHACVDNCHAQKDPDHLEYKCLKKCAKYPDGCTVKTKEHLCQKYCHEDCGKCSVMVKKARDVCPHFYTIPCSEDVNAVVCTKPCKKSMPCGHKCKNACNKPCGPCEQLVEKTIPECGHQVNVKCCEEPNRSFCKQKCILTISCGHNCTKKCCEPCTESCKELTDVYLESPCGHMVKKIHCCLKSCVLPNDKRLLEFCREPCNELLICEHACSGTCSECHQGRLHKRCTQKCGALQICNHECDTPCRKACKPCSRPCEYRCKHSKCGRKCGEPCTPCREPCGRQCFHQKCSNHCGKVCSVPPCTVPCPRFLKCGHHCNGFCGDKCPMICLVCNKDEAETIFMTFATEDEENAKFVYLHDCKHIVEHTGMINWLRQDDEEIKMKVCPLCKTPIRSTPRYTDFVKQALKDIYKVKQELNGSHSDNEAKRKQLLNKIIELETKSYGVVNLMNGLKQLRTRLLFKLNDRRQPINAMELNAVDCKLKIITSINDILAKSTTQSRIRCTQQIDIILNVLLIDDDHVTEQEIVDIGFELKRLRRMTEFVMLQMSPEFKAASRPSGFFFFGQSKPSSKIFSLHTFIEEHIFSNVRFTEEVDNVVRGNLDELVKETRADVGIMQAEKQEIVKAMGASIGHWYKCPNGHLYYIGDCGMARQQGRCSECGQTIGGQNYVLHGGNRLVDIL